jgi:hypothetical protein
MTGWNDESLGFRRPNGGLRDVRTLDQVHRISTPPRIQLCYRHRVDRCRYQVIARNRGRAVSGTGQYVKDKTEPEPAPTILSCTAHFERLAGDSNNTADLRTPRAREVDHATESGTKLVRSGDGIHDRYVCITTTEFRGDRTKSRSSTRTGGGLRTQSSPILDGPTLKLSGG